MRPHASADRPGSIEPTPVGAPSATIGLLLLADISGYTSFLRNVADAHQDDAFAGGSIPDAYGLVSSLLDGIIEAVVPPFTLSKLEGDAVFAFAEDAGAIPRGSALLDCLTACYADFRRRLAAARGVWACTCDACSRIDTLDLKFVLHAGLFVIHSIGGGRELIGPEVVLAHRLLKSGAADLVGHEAYALLTHAAATRYDVPTVDAVSMVENYEHYLPVQAHVFPLRAA
jgi:hypothetical protein